MGLLMAVTGPAVAVDPDRSAHLTTSLQRSQVPPLLEQLSGGKT